MYIKLALTFLCVSAMGVTLAIALANLNYHKAADWIGIPALGLAVFGIPIVALIDLWS